MRNDYTKTERLAMLFELGLNYHEELNRASDKRDFEKASMLLELIECVDKLSQDIENRG